MSLEALIDHQELAYAAIVVALLFSALLRYRRGSKASEQASGQQGPQKGETALNVTTAPEKDASANAAEWWSHEDFPYSAPWWLRYPASIAVFAGSNWSFFEWDKKAGWILGIILLIIGLGLIRELFIGAIVAVLAGLVLWALGAAVAAIPVSAAIIIGAMIIAQAVQR